MGLKGSTSHSHQDDNMAAEQGIQEKWSWTQNQNGALRTKELQHGAMSMSRGAGQGQQRGK